MTNNTKVSTGAGYTFIIGNIAADAPSGYEAVLTEKLRSYWVSATGAEMQPLRGNNVGLPLLTKAAIPLSDAQKRLLDPQIICGLRDVNRIFPLQPGENDQSAIQGSLLSASWQHLPAGTPVLTRTTNYSTIYIAYPGLKFEDNAITKLAPATVTLAAANPCWGWDLPVQTNQSTAYLFDLAQIVGAIPEVGALFTPFIAMLGTSQITGISWDDVFTMATCAATQIGKAQDVAVLKGELASMVTEVNDTYVPAKNMIQGTTGDDRSNAMNHANGIGVAILTSMRSALGGLSADDMGAPALVAYVSGTAGVLGLYQDLSTVDTSVTDPAQSTYITSMKTVAQEAATYIQATVQSLIDQRGDAIYLVPVYEPTMVCGGHPPVCVQMGQEVTAYYFVDEIVGYKSKPVKISDDSNAGNDVQGVMNVYSASILALLAGQLQPLLTTAASFTSAQPPYALPS